MIDLAPEHLATVRRILAARVPDCEVRAFGSRVTWTAKDYSDLDLAVVGEAELDPDPLRHLREDFEESDLPIRVDVIDWHAVSPEFRKAIEKGSEVVQEKSERGAPERKGSTPSDLQRDGAHLVEGSPGWTPRSPSTGRSPGMARDGLGKTTIGELLARDGGSVKTGPFGTTLKAKEYSTEGVPLISVGEVGYGSLRVHDATPRAPREVVERLPEYVLQAGDIVFGRKGAVDRSAMVKQEEAGWFLGSDGIRLRLPTTCDARFVAYQLQTHGARSWLLQHATGTTMASLNQSTIERLPITLPPLDEQRAIAHILGTLDDKIELNRRMSETLEAMARALFKSWFVDFDPVRAKAEGRDPCLPQPLANIFPDSFEDSEVGEIPTGWEVATLSDLAKLNPETWSKETRPAVIHYVDLSNTKWGRIDEVTGYCSGDAPSRAQRVLRPLDTIVGTVRPGNGSYALISVNGLTGSTGFAVLRPERPAHAEFAYLAASAPENIERLARLADGAAYPAVRPEVVAATQIANPGAKTLQTFSGIASSILAKVAANEAESRTLSALRDALLPKLISGELRVEDSARFLGGGD